MKALGPAARLDRAGTAVTRINTHTGVGGLGGDLSSMTLGPEVARVGGGVRQAGKDLHRLPPVGRDLAGGTGTIDRILPPNALRSLQAEYNRLAAGTVEYDRPKELTTADLKGGVPLGNGWVLTFQKANFYRMVDLNSGAGYLTWGDPHYRKIEGHKETQDVGDDTSACMLEQLSGATADFPTLCLAFSTGGDEANGFGLPLEVVIVNKQQFIHISGLNTDTPTGTVSDGALFAYRAYKADFDRAHRLIWNAQHGELRTPDGRRSNPKGAATEYTRSSPATPVRPETLFGDGYRLVGTAQGELPAADQELFARYAHACSASECKNAKVAAEGGYFKKAAVAYTTAQASYLTERMALMKELNDLLEELKAVDADITSLTSTPAQKEAARQKLAVNPLLCRAGFVKGRKVPQAASFRILFPHRVQVAVSYGPQKAYVRVYNGVAGREFTLARGQVTASDAVPTPNDELYGEQLVVLALTDDTLRFVLPGDEIDPASAANDDDRHFLRTFRTCQHRADSTRDDTHRELLRQFRRFDAADAETKTATPAAEAELVAKRRQLLVTLQETRRPLDLQLTNLHIEHLRSRLQEAALARRLRAARQAEWLADADPLLTGTAETAPAPRPLAALRPVPTAIPPAAR